MYFIWSLVTAGHFLTGALADATLWPRADSSRENPYWPIVSKLIEKYAKAPISTVCSDYGDASALLNAHNDLLFKTWLLTSHQSPLRLNDSNTPREGSKIAKGVIADLRCLFRYVQLPESKLPPRFWSSDLKSSIDIWATINPSVYFLEKSGVMKKILGSKQKWRIRWQRAIKSGMDNLYRLFYTSRPSKVPNNGPYWFPSLDAIWSLAVSAGSRILGDKNRLRDARRRLIGIVRRIHPDGGAAYQRLQTPSLAHQLSLIISISEYSILIPTDRNVPTLFSSCCSARWCGGRQLEPSEGAILARCRTNLC
jgi:hypothetical protein